MSSAHPGENVAANASEDVNKVSTDNSAQDQPSEQQGNLGQTANTNDVANAAAATTTTEGGQAAPAPAPPMSKNAMKRLKRQQEWEDSKDERRKRRKEKRHDRKSRRREEREALLAQGVDLSLVYPTRPPPVPVPVALVLDCDFERYMTDKEHISLCSQVTRSYSDYRKASLRAHLAIAGWRGKVAERFDHVLGGQQRHWRGVDFVEGDFLEAAARAREAMRAQHEQQLQKGGQMLPALQKSLDDKAPMPRDKTDPFPMVEPEPPLDERFRDVVYLTSDSPYTLDRLEPHTSYVIGGLVDKNREKGLCYRRARERGIRTAKLPIGQFMVMQSRQVLATNHVVEIMLRWLECEDWGKAFLQVIPKRKGGTLRGEGGTADKEGGEEAQANDDDDEDNEEDEQEQALEALAEANALEAAEDAEQAAQTAKPEPSGAQEIQDSTKTAQDASAAS